MEFRFVFGAAGAERDSEYKDYGGVFHVCPISCWNAVRVITYIIAIARREFRTVSLFLDDCTDFDLAHQLLKL